MKTLLRLLVALSLAAPLHADAVPSTLSFSARIQDNGRPVTGAHAFVFTLWDGADPSTAVKLWEEEKSLPVADGVVTSALGDVVAISSSVVFNGLAVFLQVTMDGTAFPVVEIRSVPYAIRSGTAESAPWSGLTGVPAGFADGIDNDTVRTLSCQTVQSANSTTAAGTFGSAGVTCPIGTILTGGGHTYVNGNATLTWVWRSFPSGNGWAVNIFNNSLGNIDVIAYARCCSVQ